LIAVSSSRIIPIGILLLVLFGLPPLGLILSGQALPPHLTRLPIPTQPGIASLSWAMLGLLAIVISGTLAPFLWRLRTIRQYGTPPSSVPGRFPWWGWMAVAWTVFAWLIAWTRFATWQTWQTYTFPLLWFGYIMVINACTYSRTGRCMLMNQPKFLMKLFILSAGFWWTFEYLNQFVQNWHYVGMEDIPSVTTVFWMTISFSTVLPAVLGTYEYLSSRTQVKASFENWHPLPAVGSPGAGWLLSILGSLGLFLIGIWPTLLFPLLWISPLLVMLGISIIRGNPTLLTPLTKGNWNPVVLSALAALICGGLWEMWNAYSLVHWEYSIPYVHGLKIFEMPVLGYAGYLPFGLACLTVVDFFLGHLEQTNRDLCGRNMPPSTSPWT
jgi:hypothetical protein